MLRGPIVVGATAVMLAPGPFYEGVWEALFLARFSPFQPRFTETR
jgi:hypothetical protein